MASYRAGIEGASVLARRVLREADRLDRDVLQAQRDLGEDAELAYAAHAPAQTGRLARGIASVPAGDEVLVHADARNPETGFDYVGVTRFGHRKRVITPRSDRAAASTIASGKGRVRGHRAALRFVIGGRVLYRRSVKGYRPTHDWADDALPEIEQRARIVTRSLGREIAVRLAT